MDIVYLETSVISHATARASSDPATAVLQDQAKRWMDEQHKLYDVVTSQLVIDEASAGDPDAASRRLALLDGMPALPLNADADAVADAIITGSMMPASARLDALHVATAALAGVQYLLTQNCKHIANAHKLPRVLRRIAKSFRRKFLNHDETTETTRNARSFVVPLWFIFLVSGRFCH